MLLPESQNKLYVKVRWIPGGTKQSAKELQDKELLKGLLKVMVMRGKNLHSNADCDPYCELAINAANGKLSLSSAHKSKT